LILTRLSSYCKSRLVLSGGDSSSGDHDEPKPPRSPPRLHARRDYQVNLKPELEIRHLHQKVDHPLSHQWKRLVEIQEIQMELISEVQGRR
jgi:hypothetical protein